MADVWINIDYEGWFAEMANRGRQLSRKGKRALLTDANRAAVVYWHRRIIPKHFEASARFRYHYQQRKAPYRKIKQQLAQGETVFVRGVQLDPERIIKGGTVDVVRAGRTEGDAETPTAVFASETKGKVTLRVPKYAGDRKNRTGRPNMGKEIKTITDREKKEIIRVWRMQFMRGVRTFGASLFVVKKRFR